MTIKPVRRIALLALAVLFLLALATAVYAQATETRLGGKVRAGAEVVVPADEVIEGDLYAAGGSVRVDGTVEGDLVVAGGRVDLGGTVGGDLLMAGGEVNLRGDVAGDARVAAGQAAISGSVTEDLAIGAGQARIESAASVGDDLLFATGRMRMGGTVDGNALGSAGTYNETGSIAGSREIAEAPEPEPPTFADRVLEVVRRYLTILAVGALLFWLAPRLSRRGVDRLRSEPVLSAVAGALTFVGVAIGVALAVLVAALLMAVLVLIGLGSLGGALLVGTLLACAVAVFGLVVAASFLAPVVTGTWLGSLALGDIGSWPRAFGALALGAAVVVVASAIPVVGPLVRLVVVIFGVGALVLMVFRRRQAPATAQVPPPPARVPPP